jgi:hypothetical protein
MYDLPSENPEEPGLPDQFHDWQPQLLSQTFRPLAVPPAQVLTAADAFEVGGVRTDVAGALLCALRPGGRHAADLSLEDGLYKQQQDSRLWIAELGIGLGLWTGTFADWERRWLRWYDSEGRWIPSEPEKIAQEQQRADQERQRAELAEQRAREAEQRVQELNERLKAAGIDPEGL